MFPQKQKVSCTCKTLAMSGAGACSASKELDSKTLDCTPYKRKVSILITLLKCMVFHSLCKLFVLFVKFCNSAKFGISQKMRFCGTDSCFCGCGTDSCSWTQKTRYFLGNIQVVPAH